MKIIKTGTIKPKWSKDIHCNTCESILCIDKQDVQYQWYWDHEKNDRYKAEEFYVTCVFCKKIIVLDFLPSDVQKHAKDAKKTY